MDNNGIRSNCVNKDTVGKATMDLCNIAHMVR